MARPRRPRRVPVELAALLDGTLSFVTEKLGRREIEVTRDFSAAPNVLGDPERLQQLFLNLFLNAADAMPDGGELHGLAAAHANEVEVRVSDIGPRHPRRRPRARLRALLHDQGRRRGQRARPVGGAGHRRRAPRRRSRWSRSDGAGTEFRLLFRRRLSGANRPSRLPGGTIRYNRAQPRAARPPLELGTPRALGSPHVDGRRLLVVDDDRAMREMLASLFKERGLAVEDAASADAALARAAEQDFDVVLSDITHARPVGRRAGRPAAPAAPRARRWC